MNSRPQYLERIRYWQGQRLRHTDLQRQLDSSEQLRWWHNRVHDAYGVGEGLTVTLADDAAHVTVAPGVAYDAFGRELFLFSEKTVYFPDANGMAQYLIASFQPPTGTEPLIHWKPAAWFQVYDGAILARQTPGGELVTDGQKVRADKRPYIGYGATIPGNTAWEYWDKQTFPAHLFTDSSEVSSVTTNIFTAKGLKLIVDTSAAGFTHIPRYFATLQGTPSFEQIVFLSRYFISDVSQARFTIHVYPSSIYYYPIGSPFEVINAFVLYLNAFQNGGLWISWLGIEPFPEGAAK
jgi:hypothetical protein